MSTAATLPYHHLADALNRILNRTGPGRNGCVLFPADADPSRYGKVSVAGLHPGAHVIVYLGLKGDIPPGLVVRHSCDVPACVNPDHLLLGTASDNMRDAVERLRNRNSRKTHCPSGHAYDGSGRRKDGRSFRRCTECERARKVRWKAREERSRRIAHLMREVWGLNDDERHAALIEWVGRNIDSTKDLTDDEARSLLAFLADEKAQGVGSALGLDSTVPDTSDKDGE